MILFHGATETDIYAVVLVCDSPAKRTTRARSQRLEGFNGTMTT